MRRPLWWILGATVALSAWALLDPSRAPAPVVAPKPAPSTRAAELAAPSTTASIDTVRPAPAPLPAHWPQVALEGASRNPFVAPAPPAPKVAATPPPPPPSAPLPPSNYRFWGRLTAPDGHRLLMLARGNDGQPVTIDGATKLEDGWTVESIGDNGVVLVHTASQRRERIPIPAEAPATPG